MDKSNCPECEEFCILDTWVCRLCPEKRYFKTIEDLEKHFRETHKEVKLE